MKFGIKAWALLVFAAFSVMLSIWGPEAFAKYQDTKILNTIHTETVEAAGAGYRYRLKANEKLYILSRCLSSQVLPESESNAMTRLDGEEALYQEPEGSYAFVPNYRGPSVGEITDEQIYETCNKTLAVLKENGILPKEIREVEPALYDATLYSAIDVLEPQNHKIGRASCRERV